MQNLPSISVAFADYAQICNFLKICTRNGDENVEMETGKLELEAGNWKLEPGNWKIEPGSRKTEAGRRKTETQCTVSGAGP